jgi:hypothetical protein
MNTATIKNAVKGAVDFLAGARSAVQGLRDHESALRGAHNAAVAERARLIGSLPPKADILAAMEGQIDALGDQWRATNEAALIRALGGSIDVAPSGEVTGLRPGSLTGIWTTAPWTAADLLSVFPTLFKARLREIIERAEYNAGPPMGDRLRLLAEVDARIGQIERDHAALVDEAGASGIRLEHLPDEHARRMRALPAEERALVVAAENLRRGMR